VSECRCVSVRENPLCVKKSMYPCIVPVFFIFSDSCMTNNKKSFNSQIVACGCACACACAFYCERYH